MSQESAILAKLERGETITPIEALNECGCFRLAARIKELRNEGHDIETLDIKLDNGKAVAGYRLRRRVEANGQLAWTI